MSLTSWERFRRYSCRCDELGIQLDISRMGFDDELFDRMSQPMAAALQAMTRLEAGSIANPDEDRMVGHYWLRAPELAPTAEIGDGIRSTIGAVNAFATDVHTGRIAPPKGDGFYVVLLIGIGGSALGPQLLCHALDRSDDAMIFRVLDNTDPEGVDRLLHELDDSLASTLTIVVSKSGGTRETRNAMLEVAHAYRNAGLDFARHAVAVTQEGSDLHATAIEDGWLRTFPLWDWVGGRTSITSAVGLLPAALVGIDTDGFLAGARAGDAATREADVRKNPAALMAITWHHAVLEARRPNLVVSPYSDRLEWLSRYLQQLIMESLGKGRDRAGHAIHQGLTVYGNKGATDQHSFYQQLRQGPNDFTVTFVRTLGHGRDHPSIPVDADGTTGDCLDASWQGTREALSSAGRDSITITLDELTPRALGALVALFERTVGLYAELINVNAYHQPGVEGGKRATTEVLALQHRVLAHLRARPGEALAAGKVAADLGSPESVECIHHILEHAAANADHDVSRHPEEKGEKGSGIVSFSAARR